MTQTQKYFTCSGAIVIMYTHATKMVFFDSPIIIICMEFVCGLYKPGTVCDLGSLSKVLVEKINVIMTLMGEGS